MEIHVHDYVAVPLTFVVVGSFAIDTVIDIRSIQTVPPIGTNDTPLHDFVE